jgi:hypothetical protein
MASNGRDNEFIKRTYRGNLPKTFIDSLKSQSCSRKFHQLHPRESHSLRAAAQTHQLLEQHASLVSPSRDVSQYSQKRHGEKTLVTMSKLDKTSHNPHLQDFSG